MNEKENEGVSMKMLLPIFHSFFFRVGMHNNELDHNSDKTYDFDGKTWIFILVINRKIKHI